MLSALLDSGAEIGLSIDDAGRIILATAPHDLARSGIVAGIVIASIDEQPAGAFLAAAFQNGEEILSRKSRIWSFIVGDRTVHVALALKDDAEAPASDAGIRHDARSADFDSRFSESVAPWRLDPRPVFQNLAEVPISNRSYHERPPRKMRVECDPVCNPDYVHNNYDPEQDIWTRSR